MDNEINDMTLEIKEKINKCIYEECSDEKETRNIFYIGDKKYKIPNPILDEYAKKYKPEELTDDGIPNINTQLKELKQLDEEQEKKAEKNKDKKYKRELTQRVKCLSLNKMDKSIMTNTLLMNEKDRKKLQDIMWEYNNYDHKLIISQFDELVGNLLDDKEIDIYTSPIYDF